MLFLWQDIPTRDGNDVHQERWHHTVLLFCKMQEERSHLQERPAQAEMDNVLWEEGTRLSNLPNGDSAKASFCEPIDLWFSESPYRILTPLQLDQVAD
jgi:hypothetical protein